MATSQILPFAIAPGSNVEPQANYAAESFVSTGFVAGIAPSAGMNKLFRQTSLISAVIAQWMADNQSNNIVDTDSVATIEGHFASSLRNKTIVTVTPVADADVTISQAAADSDIIILATGAWTTTHNVIVPNNTRTWFISSTSAYNATVKTSLGTGKLVIAGLSRLLACDSVNVIDPISEYDPIGHNQVWTDVTASRSAGTTYFNTTGKSIAVLANGISAAGPLAISTTIAVSGVVGGYSEILYAPSIGYGCSALTIVPPGASYVVTFTNCAKDSWHELR